MATHKALLIPYDETKPVEDYTFDDNDLNSWGRAVCAAGDQGMVDIKSFPTQRAQLVYDDMGLYDQPNNTNARAMKLWAHLSGVPLDAFRQPLVGNFIVLGLDPFEGETRDVPQSVRYFFGEEGVDQDG